MYINFWIKLPFCSFSSAITTCFRICYNATMVIINRSWTTSLTTLFLVFHLPFTTLVNKLCLSSLALKISHSTWLHNDIYGMYSKLHYIHLCLVLCLIFFIPYYGSFVAWCGQILEIPHGEYMIIFRYYFSSVLVCLELYIIHKAFVIVKFLHLVLI